MTRKNLGFLALFALVAGMLGFAATGCSDLDVTTGPLPNPDSVNTNPPVENVAPADLPTAPALQER